jgi:TolB protein
MMPRLIAAALLACGMSAHADVGVIAGAASVAFVSIRTGDPQIYTRDALGELRMVTEGKSLPGQPAWAPNNRLAFVARVGSTTKILVTDENGMAPQRLTADERMEGSPSWSPDGMSIAYFSRPAEGGPTELRVVELSSRRSSTLATDKNEMGPTPPSWSADGSRLAFSAIHERDRSHIWAVARDGSGLRNLSAKAVSRGAAWPAMSPDGKKVAWIADMRERMPIMVTDIESGESKELTPEKSTNNESPRWSPDGRHIVFASTRASIEVPHNDIFVMDADGSNVRNLSRHAGDDFNPKWSADGRSIVFASLRSGTSQLFEVDLVNGSVKALSQHSSHDMNHVVRPVAAAK